jgi:hypothetical protein
MYVKDLSKLQMYVRWKDPEPIFLSALGGGGYKLPTVIFQALFVEAFQNTECLPELLKKISVVFLNGYHTTFLGTGLYAHWSPQPYT